MGQGDPVVFVHGSLGDLRSWSLQMGPFSKLYRAIAYSRRYHQPNAGPGESLDYSVNLHAEDLASLIRDLGLHRPHIVGLSYGAYIALVLAAKNSELVRSLTLGEPDPFSWLEGTKEGAPLVADYMAKVWEPSKRALQRGDMEEGVRTTIDGLLGQGRFDEFSTSVRARIMENAQELRAEYLSPGLYSEFTCDDAKKIKVPVLLLTGKLSTKIYRYGVKELQRCIPGAEYSVIPKSSHAMHLDNPDAFNARILNFLSRH